MAKSLENKLSWAVEGRDSLAIDLARQDPECEANEHYKRYIVRSRLKRVPNEAVKCNTFTYEEEVQKVSLSVFRFCQVPRWTCAMVES